MTRTAPLSNAERQRRCYRRKRSGLQLVSLELTKADIAALIDRGGLSEADLDDAALVGQAFRTMTSRSAATVPPAD